MSGKALARRVIKNIPHIVRREPCFAITEVLLTYHCPERCLQCSYPQKAVTMKRMSYDDFRKIIDRLDEYGTHAIILSGGEPLLHPELKECLEYVAAKQFTYRHLLSTLHASSRRIRELVELVLKHRFALTCSFDGFGELADELRGAKNVAKIVMENMEYLDRENRKRGRPIKTGVNIVISQMNLHQIPEILSYVEKLGWLANVDVYRDRPENLTRDERLDIKDFDEFGRIMEIVKKSPAVVTPLWLLEGYKPFLMGLSQEGRECNSPPVRGGVSAKHCPYITSPSLGSRFFVHPNGDVKVCLPGIVGNLLSQSPHEILQSPTWKEREEEFERCRGCWNACLTPFAKLWSYDFKEGVRVLRQMRGYRNGEWV